MLATTQARACAQLVAYVPRIQTRSYSRSDHRFTCSVGTKVLTRRTENPWFWSLSSLTLAGFAASFSTTTYVHSESQAKAEQKQDIVLYQYEVCPFCCKVKAFLDYNDLPYDTVEVNPVTKEQLKWAKSEKKQLVPVLVFKGETLENSREIIHKLFDTIKPSAKMLNTKESEDWEKWVDDRLAGVLACNIYRNVEESWQAFDYITTSGDWSWPQQMIARTVGTAVMYLLMQSRKKSKYHIEGSVRDALYENMNQWMTALGNKNFMGGDRPNLADLAVFGVLRSITGLPTFSDVMQNTTVAPWYERMVVCVGSSSRVLAR